MSDRMATYAGSATLARSITWKGSKHFFYIALLLADRDLVDDCFRAYAYFRWADDVIDVTLQSDSERIAFAEGQKEIIRRLYAGEFPARLSAEERMLADLVSHDREPNSGLRSFIHEFMWVLAFDACRSGATVSQTDLAEYTSRLATAVMDGIQYFIGKGHPYPMPPERIRAVTGAHITHMLRDMRQDLSAGIINIPRESLASYGLDPAHADPETLRTWVRERVGEARSEFREGRRYIDSLAVLRCKLAGIWYCAKFERVLDAIERDGFRLREDYSDRGGFAAWMEMIWLGIAAIVRHASARIPLIFWRDDSKQKPSNLAVDNI